MFKLYTLLAIILMSSPCLQAQQSDDNKPRTIDEKFADILKKSNNYQEYEVIKKTDIGRIRSEIADSLGQYKTTINGLENVVDEREQTIGRLNDSLVKVNTNLSESRKKENGIFLFGMLMDKGNYNSMMLGIIGLLLVLLIVFISKYRSSNGQTRYAREKLADIEAEFETHRQRSLEREQQIRRKLQDEINKNKKTS